MKRLFVDRFLNFYVCKYFQLTHNVLHIRGSNTAFEDLAICILDAAGKRVIETKIVSTGNNSFDIDIKNLSAGTYFVLFHDGLITSQLKFVKKYREESNQPGL